ncbi:Fic family protein [Streptomyces sp. NBC_00287]|uniref:Fic family protein n=1 Tax=Streptomyces sp. NBC_00287 TaxID=2975702 RepID=UPI002E2E5C3D|nr:Fic family protein [Streptomyces sp. NBC_00287]
MTGPTAAPDHLRTWLTLRTQIPWHQAHAVVRLPTGIPLRDGAQHDIRTHDHARAPQRAARLLAALARTREDAASGAPLSFQLLSTWQREVLAVPDAPFRSHPAYAKSGRERYGITPDLPTRLDACLHQAQTDDLPLTARAARAYLDVCFFHPFDDGNARSAFLTLTFVLARAGVSLDQVGPVRRLQRRADDPEGALALADLLAVLITATARRQSPVQPPANPAAGNRSPSDSFGTHSPNRLSRYSSTWTELMPSPPAGHPNADGSAPSS